MSTFTDAVRFIADNGGLLLSKTGEHLELSGAALGIALVLALPLGLWLGHRHRGLFLAASVSSLGRALPSLALIALGTALDPRLTKGDVLVGNVVGRPGSLPAILTHITVDLQLFDQAVGSSALIKVDKVRATETLRLNIGTASTLGTVTSARDAVAELDLKKPVVAEAGGRVAISRRIAERWRLIGSGLVR